MKTQFARIKNRAIGLPARMLAVLLCFVMLVTAIGAGTLVTAFAREMSPVDAASAAIREAADKVEAMISGDSGADIDKASSSAIEDDKGLAGTGANVDLAASGSVLQTGARTYFNAHGAFTSTRAYVYMAWIWNNNKNYSIIKMDHIANTEWYTCVTANGNIVDGDNTERRGDVSNILFFTLDSGSWATKNGQYNDGAWAHLTGNAQSGYYVNLANSNLFNCYNNYVYYCNKDGLIGSYNGGNYLANHASVTQTKADWQKASVYVSNDGASYTYSDEAGQGGEVAVAGYYWSSAFSSSGKEFSSSSDDTNRYSQFNTPIVTTWITMTVTTVYDGWYFMGWYDVTNGEDLGNATTIYYDVQTTGSREVYAYFLKPEYEIATPKAASSVNSGTLLITGFDSSYQNNNRCWVYGTGLSDSNIAKTQIGSTGIYKIDNSMISSSNPITTSYAPYVILCTGSETTYFPGGTEYKVNEKTSADNTTAIYYVNNTYTWTNFVHLSATSLSADKTSAAIGEAVTLTAGVPADGTLKGTPKYNYYYTTNNSTWYKIAEDSTSNTQVFYPPANGAYHYKVAVVDGSGVETVVADSSNATVVGVAGGKYITGSKTLVGGNENWDTAPAKGLMAETSSGSGIYKLTFGSVGAGTYEFRVTTLNANGTVTWDTAYNHDIDGTASPTHVNGGGEHYDNIQFTLTEKKQVTITYNNSTKAVTVDVADVQAIPVEVHAGMGGFVEVTYGTAATVIEEGEVNTIMVAYGESINIEATPNGGYLFSKWYKNLTDDYRGTPVKDSGYDSLETEVITKRTVYCAVFSSTETNSSWKYSYDRTNATPEITGDASGKYILYNTGNTETDLGSNVHTTEVTYKSGNDYWADLTGAITTSNSSADIVLATGNANNTIIGGRSTQINGVGYNSGNGPTITDDAGNTLFTLKVKYNSTVNASSDFIKIGSINWHDDGESTDANPGITSLGVRAIYSGSGSVNYKFYYKLYVSGGNTGEDYVPSTNFYAKDAVFTGRDNEANLWFSGVTTSITAEDDQVEVQHDHDADGTHTRRWVEGKALKGSTITVRTTIPNSGTTVAYVNSSGAAGSCYPAQKYYVAGFSFNGVTPELLSWRSDGVYECTYTIPADMKETMLEITPIFFIRDEYASNTVMIYLNGYNSEMRNAGWGNTLYVYPFYRYYKGSTYTAGNETTYFGQAENFGRYPGQPVINYGGQLFMQIPLTDDATATGKDDGIDNKIKGITINNGYNDYIHKDCCSHVSVHKQTYDYDDFAKIYYEKKLKNGEKYLHSIYFSFKYFPENTTSQHRLQATTSAVTGKGNATRYNDLVSDSGILSNTDGTVASATLVSAGESSTGWQRLTDALGNDVDIFGNKVTDSEAVPLRVFSLGYEYNNAGTYATEWAIYHLDGENYKLVYDNAWGIDNTSGHDNIGYNSSIVPSALVMNSSSSFASYSAVDGDKPIEGYSGLYTKLADYAGIPVLICYEHETPDGGTNPKNYRSDGRWNYTTVNDFVKSNIIIEYTDKAGVDHFYDPSTTPVTSPDVFTNTNEGTVTGCKAFFTNSEYYGEVVTDTETISNTAKYTFEAEAQGSYEFVGWYMYDTAGHMSTITTDKLAADTLKSGNFVIAARFRYVSVGSLTISHSLAAGNAGRGTTYLGVTVINGDKETVLANVNSNTAPVTIDKSYINSSSPYSIRIDIRTTNTGENTYNSYNCYRSLYNSTTTDYDRAAETRTYDDSDPAFATAQSFYNSSANTTATATYTLKVKEDVYNSTTTQQVKTIEYVSTMNPVHYTYSVTYNYTSRQYGDQAFTKTGELTSGQINDTNIVTGTQGTADKKLKPYFLAQIAPHESNLNSTISWNFEDVYDSQTCSYDGDTNTYAISLDIAKAQQTSAANVIRGYFTVPYAVNENGVAAADGEGKTSLAAENTFTVAADYNTFFYSEGTTLITAPAVIYDGETERPFQYWEIWTASSSRGDSKLVGKCYWNEFTYRALDNYNIVAHYGVAGDANYNELYSTVEKNTTSISFIGNSRNQWNNDAHGSHTYYAGDLIYNDFIISYNPTGDTLFKDLATADCGIIIQRLKQIETNSSGANAKTLQEYARDYSSDNLTDAAKAAMDKLKSTSTATGSYTQIKVNIGKASVNNKNRCHYAYSMFNTAEKTSGSKTTTNNAKYLYRAYSYMKIGDGDYILSDTPTYFYMYDIAQL